MIAPTPEGWNGIHPSSVTPLFTDGRLDEAALAARTASVAATPGIVALPSTGHAAEHVYLWCQATQRVTAAYQASPRAMLAATPHVRLMTSGDAHLLACSMLDSDGLPVSLAAIIPEAIVTLDAAVRGGDPRLQR